MFKNLNVVSLLIVVTLYLAGCSTTPAVTPTKVVEATKVVETQPDSNESIELVVWTGKFGDYLKEQKEQFEKEHPNVKVRFDDMGWDQELYQNVLNAVKIGTVPDVIVGESYVQQLATAGHLLPVDEAIASLKADMIPGTYKGAEYEGKIYGVSNFTGVFGLERNCKVITEAGLDCNKPPQTWDELLAQAKTITEKGQGKFYGYSLQGTKGFPTAGVFRMSVYFNQADGVICQNNCTEPYFNNPKTLPVLEFLRQLNQYTPPGLTTTADEGQVYTALFEGKSAYQIAGSWHPDWAKKAGCQDCRYSAIPIPSGGHAANIIVGNVIYSVMKQSKQPDLAMEWIKLVARPDMQDLVFPMSGRLPSTRSALTKLRPTADAATQAFIDELLNNPALTVLPQWQEPPKTWKIYNELLDKVLNSDQPIQKLMDDAQTAAESLGKK